MGIHSGMDHIDHPGNGPGSSLPSGICQKKRLQKRCNLLEEGALFEDALSESGLFEGLDARLITVGLRAGAADEVMNKLADRYRDLALTATGNIISIVEPYHCDSFLSSGRSGPSLCYDAFTWNSFRNCCVR